MTPRHTALAGLALGLLIAVTANVAYAAPRGPVVLGVGVVAPLVLPLVLYLRTLFDVDGWKQWVPRELATLAVAGPAVAVSYWHTYALVLGAGEPWLLAVLAPLSSDGLAGMATLALHRLRTASPVRSVVPAKARSKARTAAKPPTVADAVEAAETAPTELASKPTELASKQAASGAAIDWARTSWPVSAREIQNATGVAKGSAHRIRNKVAAEIEAAS